MNHLPTRCLVADDHPILIEIVRLRLQTLGCEVVGEAANGAEALRMAQELQPDIAVIDIQMPELDGIEVVERMAQLGLPTKALIFTARDSPLTIRRAMLAGAYGYIGKSSPESVLAQAVQAVASGQRYIDPLLTGAAYDRPAVDIDLAPEEIGVLQLLAHGHSDEQIGAAIGGDQLAVDRHVDMIIRKLRVTGRSSAVAVALREGIVA